MVARPPAGAEGAITAPPQGVRSRWGVALIAVVSLLLPGVGHLSVGAPRRGVLAWLASRVLGLIALGAVVVWPGRPGLAIYIVAIIAIAVGVACDAVGVARRRRPPEGGAWFTSVVVRSGAVVVVVAASLA